MEIPLLGKLGDGKVAIVDDEDFDFLIHYKWRYSDGYARREKRIGKKVKHFVMHRDIMSPPTGFQVDHINGNRLDNRKENLRLCTSVENCWNSKSAVGESGFRGVSWARTKWQVQIRVNKKSFYLGRFSDKLEAARAYDSAAKKIHGKFARLNFPNA